MPEIEVHVPPVPKARPRLGKGGRVFTPRTTELAEHRIRETWREAFGVALPSRQGDLNTPWTGPLLVEIVVRIARPAGHYRTSRGERLPELLPRAPRWPAVRPDLDNYGKTALDALRGVAFVDDGQVVRLELAKVYARDGEAPGWRIGVFAMEDTEDGDDHTGDPAPAAG